MIAILNWFDNSDHVFGLLVVIVVTAAAVRYACGKDLF